LISNSVILKKKEKKEKKKEHGTWPPCFGNDGR